MTAILLDGDETDEPPALPKRQARALSDSPERIKHVPVDQELLERVLDGLRALPPVPYRWRPGFLSRWLHAVPADSDEWEFLEQRIQWAACGAPVLKADVGAGRTRCPKCSSLSADI